MDPYSNPYIARYNKFLLLHSQLPNVSLQGSRRYLLYPTVYIGIMEKKMETTIYRVLLELYWDNGKENGNYYI